ncbi:hypothetical protein EVAR_91628_1 [Eumeta japonica]|uniref:Uncharacterized protein n=1 Tax=Eumeta variegata TaxID=151549 RepID=A0A4C1UY00_EUMVA|nr:hypothetical protein EVAR_91628_1 [Eumeta japonica]
MSATRRAITVESRVQRKLKLNVRFPYVLCGYTSCASVVSKHANEGLVFTNVNSKPNKLASLVTAPKQIEKGAYAENIKPSTSSTILNKNDENNQDRTMTKTDKLKALHRSGPRTFSGPVEKIIKWHKALQGIGVFTFYEVVAKCLSIRAGEGCKQLLVRDEGGPAVQIMYYEIDFLLPELHPPCMIRAVGKAMPGSSRLQAYSVRLATGDDIAALPRRAAVADHHVAKLCKEYGDLKKI